MNKLIGRILLVLLTSMAFAHAEMRIWTSVKGDAIEAEFIKIFSGKVVLKRADGKELKISTSGLCAADRKYLSESIPPQIDIEVDVENDKKNLASHSSAYRATDYSRKEQKIRCKVTIEKKSREENSTKLKARIFVFSEDSKMDELYVILKSEHEFSFEHQKIATFSTDTASLTITKRSGSFGSRRKGREYDGYVVCVEDGGGNIVGLRGSRKLYEENISKIRKANKGSKFDDHMNLIRSKKKGKKS